MVTGRQLNRTNERYQCKVAKLSGIRYNIYRPCYTEVDNEPQLIRSRAFYRVDTGAKKFLEMSFVKIEVLSVFGSRKTIQPGDILIKETPDVADDLVGNTTLLYWEDLKELVGLRTSRKCNVAYSQDQDTGAYNYLHQNVFFDIQGVATPTGVLTNPPDKDGTPRMIEHIVMYKRDDMTLPQYSGLTILETDFTGVETGRSWTVIQTDWSGPLMVLTVRRTI